MPSGITAFEGEVCMIEEKISCHNKVQRTRSPEATEKSEAEISYRLSD